MVNERMFSPDSYDEIATKEEANAVVNYYANNVQNFRRTLLEEGLSYEQVNNEIKAVWVAILNMCKRVGYTDTIVRAKRAQYGISEE